MKIAVKTVTCLVMLFTLSACGKDSLVGKRYYVLNGNINSLYYASLKEIQLDFISSDKLEVKMTMYADASGYKLISDKKDTESKIFNYSYDSGFLSVPQFGLTSRLTELDNGDFVTNENEYLYATSIVDILGTKEASDRLEQSSRGGAAKVFKKFIEKPTKPLIRKEGDQIIFNDK